MSLSLLVLQTELMTMMRVVHLDLTVSGYRETLCRGLVCLNFSHFCISCLNKFLVFGFHRVSRKRLCDLFLYGVNYHGHESALKIRCLIDGSRFLDSLAEALKDLLTDLLMAHLTSAEAQYDLDLIALAEETQRVLDLCFEIMCVDTAGKLYLLDFDNVLLFLCFLLSLFLLIAIAAVVGDTTNGRLCIGGNEDQVKTLIIRGAKSIVRRHNTDLFTVGSDNSYFFSLNGLVYEQFFCSYNSSPPKMKNDTKTHSVPHKIIPPP